jgi:4-amino-4-deoxy-L-arabinose transferase-like glycosyltransferase
MTSSAPPCRRGNKPLPPRTGLALILALYFGLAAGYAAVTPFGQPPDETAHALYVQHLVQEQTFPMLRRSHREAYEFHQPPLYYLLASPAWAAGSRLSPAAARTGARVVAILIGAVGIWLIGLLAWAVGIEGDSARDALALAAAGFAALLPMRLATAASVSNDTLAEAVFTAGLLLMVRMIREGPTLCRAALLGLTLGLGILTKSSDLLLFPVALAALLFATQATGDRRQATAAGHQESGRGPSEPGLRLDGAVAGRLLTVDFVRCAAVTFGVALLIGGGWIARSARLYGDPLGTRAFEQYFQDTPTPAIWGPLLGYNLLDVLWHKVVPLTFDSFWGVFGHMELFMGAYPRGADAPGWTYLLADHGYPPPSWVYPLLLIPTMVAAAGLGVQALRRSGVQHRPHRSGPSEPSEPERLNAQDHRCAAVPPERLTLLLTLAWFLVLAAFLRFNLVFFQAQGRYLFPAMGPIALGFAAGWLAWWPPRRKGTAVLLLFASMLALAFYALFGTLMSAFSGVIPPLK